MLQKGKKVMDVCGNILKATETKNAEYNDELYAQVLQEFLGGITENITFNGTMTSGMKVRKLKDQYIYTSKYVKTFFDILEKYNYNMKQEIKDAMFHLGNLKDPNKNEKLITKLLNSPVIDDISFNGKDKFTIFSDKYGKTDLELATSYFKDNQVVIDYIENTNLPRKCHQHTLFLSELFEDNYSITSLCRYYFRNGYYHSYSYDKENNKIIDLCFNGVVNKDEYYNIYEPKDISIIPNDEVDIELALTDTKSNQDPSRCGLLKIALYKEYLNFMGYEGTLEEAPYVKCLKNKI